MSKITGTVSQGGADTFTTLAVETNIQADGKEGWEFFALEVWWSSGEAVAAADYEVIAALQTVSTASVYSSPDEIARVGWAIQNTGGVAVAIPYEPIKSIIMLEPRLTVQPTVYFALTSTLTGASNIGVFRAYYNTVKLSDLEVLRLLAGGA